MVRWSPPGRLAMPGKDGCAGLAPSPAQPSPYTVSRREIVIVSPAARERGEVRVGDDGSVVWGDQVPGGAPRYVHPDLVLHRFHLISWRPILAQQA